ncbi:MAG TPA: T9SS type A sorting domain-containing protein, partial [Candidatus Syntrophosphaera sp.]|nr:T9SS type A sorting domain-containing protein [Candidatus Syntrophosphaera sp.]
SHNGMLSLPTAASYYGGIPVEIYDISASGKNMTFSVSFGWRLSTGYSGENHINACSVDFDGDGGPELVYPQPDGAIHIFKDELPLPGFPLYRDPIEYTYVWDGIDFYFPMQVENLARLYRLSSSGGEYLHTFGNKRWATHPLSDDNILYLPLNDVNSQASWIYQYEPGEAGVDALIEFEYPIISNLAWFRDQLYIPSRQESMFCVWQLAPNYPMIADCRLLDVPSDSTVVAVFVAPITPQNPSSQGEVIVQCLNSIYAFDSNNNLLPGFPYVHDLRSTAPLSIEDWDVNGTLDLLISSDRGVAVIDYAGSRMSPAALNLAASDSLAFSSGVLAADIDHDGKKELLGSFGFNRLHCWEDNFRAKPGYPVSFGRRSRNLPFIAPGSDGLIYAWLASDDGSIYRQALPEASLADLQSGWNAEYGSLLRQASRDGSEFPNQYETTELFVPGEFYIFPNPLKSIYAQQLTLNVMTSRDTALEVKIFDINGSLIYRQSSTAKAWLRNRDVIDLPADRLRSGVYICVVSGDRDSRSIKFAVEK